MTRLVPLSGLGEADVARFVELSRRRRGPSPWRDASGALLRGEHAEAAERFARIGVRPEEGLESVGASAYIRRLDLL